MEGFMVKKYHRPERRLPPYYQIRMMYYRPGDDVFDFKVGLFKNYMKVIHLKEIMGITKWEVDPTGKLFSTEGMKKNLQIHLQSDTHLPQIVYYGFFDEETRDLFYDGLRLIYKEYRRKQASYRRSLLQKVATMSNSEK